MELVRNFCIDFCMDFGMNFCMDTCLGVWNTSFCVDSLLGMVVWFGCGPQCRKNLYRENVGFYGRCPFFLNPYCCFSHKLAITH